MPFFKTATEIYALVILLCLMSSSIEVSAEIREVNVLIGGDSDLDACGLIASVEGLQPVPGNFLNVRSGPSQSYPIVGQLIEGAEFIQCDRSADADWLGIVVPTGGGDCGLGEPITDRGPYEGSCLSGWVHRSFTTLKD